MTDLATPLPALNCEAPGWYGAPIETRGFSGFVHVEQTDIETRGMFGRHGWFWSVQCGPIQERSEECFGTKRECVDNLRLNWAQVIR